MVLNMMIGIRASILQIYEKKLKPQEKEKQEKKSMEFQMVTIIPLIQKRSGNFDKLLDATFYDYAPIIFYEIR